jgi:DNA-binding NarL/FixJ family response regulator
MAETSPSDTIADTENESRRRHSGRGDWIHLTLKESSQNQSQSSASLVAGDPIRVVLVIRSKIERLGWSIVLETQTDLELLGRFSSVSAALAFLAAHPADAVLIDEAALALKDCEALRRLAAQGRPHFLMITRHPFDEAQERSRYSFASAFLLKGVCAADLLAAIRHSLSA